MNFPDNPEKFRIIQTFSMSSRKLLVNFKHFRVQHAKTFRTRKNFPGSNATMLPTFFCLCHKLKLLSNPCSVNQPRATKTKELKVQNNDPR